MDRRLAARLLWGRVRRTVASDRARRHAERYGTRAAGTPASLRPRLTGLGAMSDMVPTDPLRSLCEHYLEHRFDLLGSGWVVVRHGMSCRGLEGYVYGPDKPVRADPAGRWLEGRINASNVGEARRVWSLVDADYQPIDWQLDFKSGYRWSEREWCTAVRIGHLPGVDVKVPWELARMQHLPQLALAHALAVSGRRGMRPPDRYAAEFRNQVLDFIATNPPAFGVNWSCAMDVGIRVLNWTLAYDMFRAAGASFGDDFERELARSVFEHGRHIASPLFLEWRPGLRGNHYLADLVGLLYAAAYLPRTPQTDAWLAFAMQELGREIPDQFLPDGGNFEGSTSYHRLSTELCAYAVALVLGLTDEEQQLFESYERSLVTAGPGLAPAPLAMHESPDGRPFPLPPTVFSLLERAGMFTAAAMRGDGRVVQVGDNDSGRAARVVPEHRRMTVRDARERYANLDGYRELPDESDYWMEQPLDHRHLLAALRALFDREDFGPPGAETELLRGLAGGHVLPPAGALPLAAVGSGSYDAAGEGWSLRIEVGAGAREGLVASAFPEFGLYVLRSDRVFCAVRCGPVGQRGQGGHGHNDQLSLELSVDGRDVVLDPGTYLYTPLPGRRDDFRSVRAHFAPRAGHKEPASLEHGVFSLPDRSQATCLRFDDRGFVGRHVGFGQPVVREVRLEDDAVVIVDRAPPPADVEPPGPGPLVSPGYGLLLASVRAWVIERSAWVRTREGGPEGPPSDRPLE